MAAKLTVFSDILSSRGSWQILFLICSEVTAAISAVSANHTAAIASECMTVTESSVIADIQHSQLQNKQTASSSELSHCTSMLIVTV